MNANDGSVSGAAWVTGDRSLSFDGTDDSVNCGSDDTLDLSGPLTVSAWVCPDSTLPGGEVGVVGKDFSSYFLSWYSDGKSWWYIGTRRQQSEHRCDARFLHVDPPRRRFR